MKYTKGLSFNFDNFNPYEPIWAELPYKRLEIWELYGYSSPVLWRKTCCRKKFSRNK